MSYQVIEMADFVRAREQNPACICVDVRSPVEFQAEHCQGSVNVPLSELSAGKVRSVIEAYAGDDTSPIYLMCLAGMRSEQAAQELRGLLPNPLYVVSGGIKSMPGSLLLKVRRAPLPIIRQVMILAGSMVLLGVALGLWFAPWGFALSAAVATGMLFAGVTGICPAEKFLSLMPWNREV